MGDLISMTLKHPIRRKLIEALAHSSVPLSAQRFRSEYIDAGKVTLGTVNYHVTVLEKEGIVNQHGRADEGSAAQTFVLGDGPKSREAVRLLQQTPF